MKKKEIKKVELIGNKIDRVDELLNFEHGLIYYNYSSDMLLVRSVIHDFGAYNFILIEALIDLENCEIIGEL